MIRAILTDLGNVVCPFDRQRQVQNFRRLCPELDLEHIRTALFDQQSQQYLQQLECNGLSAVGYKHHIEKLLGIKGSLPDADFWRAHTDIFDLDLPVMALWSKIKRLHPLLKLIAVSDTDQNTLEHVCRLSHLKFDYAVTSYMARVPKPDPRIFELAIKRAQCRPVECFFTDDEPTNVEGAKACGIEEAHQFTNFSELQDIICTLDLL